MKSGGQDSGRRDRLGRRGAVYAIDAVHTDAANATWEKCYGTDGSLGTDVNGQSFAWSIDNVNVPEPVSLALLGLSTIDILRRRSA